MSGCSIHNDHIDSIEGWYPLQVSDALGFSTLVASHLEFLLGIMEGGGVGREGGQEGGGGGGVGDRIAWPALL